MRIELSLSRDLLYGLSKLYDFRNPLHWLQLRTNSPPGRVNGVMLGLRLTFPLHPNKAKRTPKNRRNREEYLLAGSESFGRLAE